MPSPFPGMDPFIEDQQWQSFHTQFVTALGQALVAQVRPQYVVEVQQYVYLARAGEREDVIGPDVAIALARGRRKGTPGPGARGAAVAARPVVRTLPTPRRRRQHYLTISTRRSQRVTTVIELLSPWNKSPGDGQEEYVAKRQNVFAAMAHLVEIDLLRGGRRLPTVEPPPPGEYRALVCRWPQLPKVDVYAWGLRRPMPTIPVPLADGDADARLDLQDVFSATYDLAGFDYVVDYEVAVAPPLNRADAAWAREVLGSAGRRTTE